MWRVTISLEVEAVESQLQDSSHDTMQCKEDNRRRSATLPSPWRCSYNLYRGEEGQVIISMSGGEEVRRKFVYGRGGKNPTYQEMVSKKLKIFNNSSLDWRRFVENYLPQHKEVGNWVAGVEYSLGKKGRWKILDNIAAAWRDQREELAEEVFDITVVDARYRKNQTRCSGEWNCRRLFRNYGETTKTNVSRYSLKTEKEPHRRNEVQMCKRKNQSNMSCRREDENNYINMAICNEKKGCRKYESKIPLRCDATDKYTRRTGYFPSYKQKDRFSYLEPINDFLDVLIVEDTNIYMSKRNRKIVCQLKY